MTGPADEERFRRGLEAYASQFRLPAEQVFGHLRGLIGEPMAREAVNAAAAAWTDDVLSQRERSLIVVATLMAQGGVEERLRGHVRWALDHGATAAELEALAALVAVYAGYPRASLGAEVIQEVVRESATE